MFLNLHGTSRDEGEHCNHGRSLAELIGHRRTDAFIAKALGDIARAKGMTEVARDAGLSREGRVSASATVSRLSHRHAKASDHPRFRTSSLMR